MLTQRPWVLRRIGREKNFGNNMTTQPEQALEKSLQQLQGLKYQFVTIKGRLIYWLT